MFINFPCSSKLSSLSIMSGSSTPTIVYCRRKLRRESPIICLTRISADFEPCDDYRFASSSEVQSMATKEPYHSGVEIGIETVNDPINDSTKIHFSMLESSNRCPDGKEPSPEEGLRINVIRASEYLTDRCSSSKSILEHGSVSLKTDLNDTGECSSSGASVAEELPEHMSERDICISILRSKGLLGKALPARMGVSTEESTFGSNNCCELSCKVCGKLENTLNMLICDGCEDAFHVLCCNRHGSKILHSEWLCQFCLKKKHKIRKEKNEVESESESGPISFMLKEAEPYITSVRIGNEFQAEVPDWTGPIANEVDLISMPLEIDPSEYLTLHDRRLKKPSSSIGNWLQCQEVIAGGGEDGSICGKWRRAPLFEVQTDNWECFCAVLWDPAHADCAVPQELETDEVMKQLKYIEMLKPRLVAKRRKLDSSKSND